jgi:hypothetical protein
MEKDEYKKLLENALRHHQVNEDGYNVKRVENLLKQLKLGKVEIKEVR